MGASRFEVYDDSDSARQEMTHRYYSQREGSGTSRKGLCLKDICELFVRVYMRMRADGYFDQAFGFVCIDAGDVAGEVVDPELEILLAIHKKGLWPPQEVALGYSEEDLFDIIEFLYRHVSKPIDGQMHSYGNCGMHWETFNRADGQERLRAEINRLLANYERAVELSAAGEILVKAEEGFEGIFAADVPSRDEKVTARIDSAVLRFRRHGSSIDDRRQAVRDLADVLEYLRPKMEALLTSKDERDLFDIANNFNIRHHNERQKTNYDAALWLSWMFYFYLATIHVILRKMQNDAGKK
jgi:hypothetical protein